MPQSTPTRKRRQKRAAVTTPEPDEFFFRMSQVIDLILDPSDSESVIGDLRESYEIRRLHDARHARRWLRVQALTVLIKRVLNLLSLARARAGN